MMISNLIHSNQPCFDNHIMRKKPSRPQGVCGLWVKE